MLMFIVFVNLLFLFNVHSRPLDVSMASLITSVIPEHQHLSSLDSTNGFGHEFEYLIK